MNTMREMSKELTAAGIMEEMIEETLEGLEPEEMEEQAQVCCLCGILQWRKLCFYL